MSFAQAIAQHRFAERTDLQDHSQRRTPKKDIE